MLEHPRTSVLKPAWHGLKRIKKIGCAFQTNSQPDDNRAFPFRTNNGATPIPNGPANVTPLTLFHTALSVIALLLGLPVVGALMGGRNPQTLVAWFLAASVVTTLTGFFFPFNGFTPAIGVGIVSCIVLALGLIARYALGRRGGWRHVDTLALLLTEYFLIFVGIAQSFLKIPALHAIAPTGMETPFKIAQGVLFTALIVVAVVAIRARPGTRSMPLGTVR
jgi:hypothetical protein